MRTPQSTVCHDTGVRVSDFDFELPDRLIAQHPRPRGASRLLVVDRGTGGWTESRVADLPQWLRRGDRLVVNDSRVFPARLLGRRQPGGGRAECLLLERNELVADYNSVISYELIEHWWALVNPGRKLPAGAVIDFTESGRAPGVTLRAEIVDRDETGRSRVRLIATGAPVDDAIDQLGHIPLPPYIRRPDTAQDRLRYQTMFARNRGSIAAPTAGLHFDDALVSALEAGGIPRTTVTLHVGYGTFQPVKVDDTRDHRVDAERWQVSPAAAGAIAATRAGGGRVVAVGTTTTRALEASARLDGVVHAGSGATDLCITPGHTFRVVDALLTNFHLPKSSLLLLVAAFAGRELILEAYRDAVARDFTFYSYGDAMLIR